MPLILRRPFLSTAHVKIDVYRRKITLRVGEEKIIFKSVKPASSLIKRVYMLSLRERMELDLEVRLMGETLVLNRSLDPFVGTYKSKGQSSAKQIQKDIITNGDQATNDPASSSAPKTSLAANARRNNEKALNILLSAIPDRHLLSFHDAVDARTLWLAIKARFGGNEASKKMQKNLLKQQFETFTIGSREELDSAYERFQHILSMLELYDAKVSQEDANLKFLRSLPSVWHVVATMIRGQPGLDELEFDDLYNNLKVYEHELKGVSTSSSQNIAFLSTEVKGSTLKQSTADPDNISKGYTQATSSKVKTAPNYDSHSDEIICSFFSQQASMPTTHDDEDLLQIDEDAMEEIDIRWQVAMITARIRKFMRKTGRPIDLKPKNGITFDKSKIECFNCQKLGHFAKECRFAKYQENRANGRQEKKIVAIEDSNSKALVATDNNDDIDWTKEFDAEPEATQLMITKTPSLMSYKLRVPSVLNVVNTNKVVNQEKTKTSQPEIDRNKVIIEDWVDSDDEETDFSEIQKKTVFNSENSETSFENKSPNSQNMLSESRTKGLGNKGGARDTNHLNNIKRVNHSNFSGNSRYPHQRRSFIPSAVLTREGLKSTARPSKTQTVPSKSTANVFYQGTARPRVQHAVLSQSTGRPYYPRLDNIRPRTSSFSPSSRSSTTRTPYRPQRPKKIMKSIWVKKESIIGSQAVLTQKVSIKRSDMIKPTQIWRPKGAYLDSVNRDNGSYTLKQFEYGNPEEDFKDYAIIDSGCSRSMTGDKDKLSDFKEFKGGYVAFGNDPKGLENRLRHKVKIIRCDHGTEFKNQFMNEFCAKKGIKREYSIARTPQQNGVAERKNRTLIEAARTMLADSLLPIQFWAEAVNTACYVLNRVLVTKPQMKTPYEILMGRSPNISFMRPFGCSLTILNTLDQLGKFDGKSEEGYLLGYSTSSKGFRVYNRITRKVQECLHVDFLENQENQKGKGPDWMFDLDLLTPSMNYIPVRKENYADSGEKVSTLDDVEDLDDQQFIVHTAQPMHSEERTAAKETPLPSKEQALHDELMSLMHQESLAKAHNDSQRIAFEEEKRRISLAKGKESVNSTLTLSTANTPSQSTGNTPTDSDDDVPKDGVFSTNSFDDEHTDTEEDGPPNYNNM
ncbi:putative ribonuclease H-like domain-containing protein, partial [Tanacetum coccineum]